MMKNLKITVFWIIWRGAVVVKKFHFDETHIFPGKGCSK